MPINRLLNDGVFAPEEIDALNQAYDIALTRLCLVDRNDPITEIVAKKVVDVARSGITDPAQIADITVKSFGI
jgi:hypothetical protein